MSNLDLQLNSFRYLYFGSSCCGDDFMMTENSRYDLERLQFFKAVDPEQANLIIFQGTLNSKMLSRIKEVIEQCGEKPKVVALGACACTKGLFSSESKDNLEVDVYVVGCPPRPEAIMSGLLSLNKMKKELS